MKALTLLTAFALLGLAACSAKVTSGGDAPTGAQSEESWGGYSQQALTGRVMGQDWTAATAVVVPFGADTTKVSVKIYSEKIADACITPNTTKPYASMVIPKAYTVTEYASDLMNGDGNPMVFTQGSNNLIAEISRLRIDAIAGAGFSASVFAKATEESGAISQINGKISVTDCSKVTSLADWNEVSGWYNLVSFDGRSVKPRTSIIEKDQNHKYYSRELGRYVDTLVFSLYDGVGENSDSGFMFGPMDGLGTTVITEANGVKTFVYSYHGPLNFRAMDITLNLDMTVKKSASGLDVSYTLEIPNYQNKVSHQFNLTK